MHLRRSGVALAGLITLTGLVLSPVTSASATGSPSRAPAVSTIDWGTCEDQSLAQAGAECGVLTVPLDHDDPSGPTIQLAVSRIQHDPARPYRGVMLTNPGGPGGSGLSMVVFRYFVPGHVATTYDWIGLDPRGVGSSVPSLSCDEDVYADRQPDFLPTTDTLMQRWLDRTEAYSQDCADADTLGLLDHMRTTDTVADLESLREALGADTVSFYGASYGTYLAQVYATLHPDVLDKMVLDGVIDPDQAWYQANLSQDPAFQRVYTKFFRWTARHHRQFGLGGTEAKVEHRYHRMVRNLREQPVHGIGPTELEYALLLSGYVNLAWPDVAGALADLAHRGRVGAVRSLYRAFFPVGPGADNSNAAYLATECTDAPWPAAWQTWESDTWAVHEQAPDIAWPNTWFNASCHSWPAAAGQPVEVSGAAFTRPILMINETFDAATPFAGALRARQLFPTASLIEGVGGTTHAAALYGISCVDDAIRAYLVDGTTPPRQAGDGSDQQCPGLPAPTLGNHRTAPTRPWTPLR